MVVQYLAQIRDVTGEVVFLDLDIGPDSGEQVFLGD